MYQYEISNFARPVTHGIGLRDSRHNLKYWKRQPYLGFGVDAHSMLVATRRWRSRELRRCGSRRRIRWKAYSSAAQQLEPVAARVRQLVASRTLVDAQAALEESFFLGLRMNRGVSLSEIARRFGEETMQRFEPVFDDLVDAALLDVDGDQVRLTSRGRLLSNEVFARFLRDEPSVRA